jgi:hypothetical protein
MEKRVLSGIEGRFDVDKLVAGDSGDKIHRFRHKAIDERAMVSPSKAKFNSSAGRVWHNPGEGVVSVVQILPKNTESSKLAVPGYHPKRES